MTELSHAKTRLLSEEQKHSVKYLWAECFGDSADFIDFMLNGALSDSEIFMLCHNGGLCSMFFLLRIQLKCADNMHTAYYLYAAATRKNMRGMGYFSQLLAFSYKYIEENGGEYLMCRPADEGLFSFYEKFGFSICTFFEQKQIKPENKGYNFKRSGISDKLYAYYLCECQNDQSAVIKDKDTFLSSISCAIYDGDAEIFEFESGFLILKDKKDIIYICSGNNKADIAKSLFFHMETDGNLTEYNKNGCGLPYAMIKSFNGNSGVFCICSLLFD